VTAWRSAFKEIPICGKAFTHHVEKGAHAGRSPQIGMCDDPAGTLERYRLQEWLALISSELHKMFSPWLFHPEHGELAERAARAKIAERFAILDAHLAARPYLLGDKFTVADAYAFAIVGWSRPTRIDLALFPNLNRFMERVATRPRVREAMRAEGLVTAA